MAPAGGAVESVRKLRTVFPGKPSASIKKLLDDAGGNVQQVKVFKALHKLLRAKMDSQQRARADRVSKSYAHGGRARVQGDAWRQQWEACY